MSARGGAWPLKFFIRRWRRQVPPGLLFWRDMVLAGSLMNLAAAFAGLMALGFKAELPVALVLFHAPLPYNLFLFGAVWRTSETVNATTASSFRLGAFIWLLAVTIL